jgi:hypothetical protein
MYTQHNECVKHKFALQELEDQKLELVPTPNMEDPSHSPTQMTFTWTWQIEMVIGSGYHMST